MADGTEIQVEDIAVHPASGHISIKVKTVTTQGTASWAGPSRTYGCDAAAFQTRFKGDVNQLKAWVKSQHSCYQGVHADLVKALNDLKGKAI